MAEYKTIKDINVGGKRVLVRLDLNVPIKDGKIKDMTRIDASIPTIKYIIEKNGKAILMSHLGRPDGKKDPSYSLKPVAEALSQKIGKKVAMAPDCKGEEVIKLTLAMKNGDVMLLENLRFYPDEEGNSSTFVESLSKLGDVYVNDAFGTAHREHASTYGLALKFREEKKEVAAGFLMDEELRIWEPFINEKGSAVAIVGGAKLEEKIKAVKKLAKSVDRVILGGVVANVFMKASGYSIGCSLYAEKGKEYTEEAKEALSKQKNISIPSKVVVANKEFIKKGIVEPKKGIPSDQMSVDIIPSPEDISAIKKAKRIVWFGPLGVYEKGFTEGTEMIVKAISESSAYTVIGGGDLAAAAKGVNAKISTGGGASIQYITTGQLPGLEALKS